jgi:hypothetical protein
MAFPRIKGQIYDEGFHVAFAACWGEMHGELEEMGGASAEWIYLRADIPRSDYESAAIAINPVK